MAKLRVYEIAKELVSDNSIIIETLKEYEVVCEEIPFQKEELSIFLKEQSNNCDTHLDGEYETSDNDIENLNPALDPSFDDLPMPSKNGSSIITATLSIIGFFISVIVIAVTLNIYAKTWLIPETVKTIIKSQINSDQRYTMLRLRIERLEAKLVLSKKLSLNGN